MAAISLGISAVEERLEELRSRLNLTHSMDTLLAAFAGCTVAIALAVALGALNQLRQNPGLLVLGILAWLVLAAAVSLRIRSHWLSVQDVAQLADRQGHLAERLTTLVALRERKQSSRFASILVAQSLALGARWDMNRIAPWQIPRSAYAMVVSLFLLGAAAWIAPEPPPGSEPPAAAQAASDEPAPPIEQAPVNTGSDSVAGKEPAATGSAAAGDDVSGGDDGAAATDGEPSISSQTSKDAARGPRSDDGARAATTGGNKQGGAGAAASLPQRLAQRLENLVPDGLRQSLAGGFYSQKMHDASALGEDKNAADSDPARADNGAQAQEAQGKGSQPGNQPNRSSGANRSEPAKDPPAGGEGGNATHGGDGDAPGSVLASTEAGASASEAEPKTFKLTLTTFLQNLDAREAKQQKSRKPADKVAAAPAAANAELSDHQQQDDAMRKAEIPPEFEELVRRVYSLRPQPPQEGE